VRAFVAVVVSCLSCTSLELVDPVGTAEFAGVSQLFGNGSNAYVIPLRDGTLVVDTKLAFAAGDVTRHLDRRKLTPRWVAITHAHQDHLEGLPVVLAAGDAATEVLVAAPIATAWGAAAPANTHGTGSGASEPLPGHTGEEVRIFTFDHAHTGGDLVVWLPERGVLITGDLFQCGWFPHAERDEGGSWLGLSAAIETLAQLQPAHVVGGHGTRCSGADFGTYAGFLRSLSGDAESPDYKEFWLFGKRVSSRANAVDCARFEVETGPWAFAPTFKDCDGRCIATNPTACPPRD